MGKKAPLIPYILPFAAFLLSLAVFDHFSFLSLWAEPIRLVVVGALCLICWPPEFPFRFHRPFFAALVGVGVLLIWIGPDLLFPHYREGLLFTNPFVAQVHSRAQPSDLGNNWFLMCRTMRAVLVVPIVEELFWRGWLMRWLVRPDFETVSFGAYRPLAFWATAILFASEHGSYWDVGLAAGLIYNWFAVRTKSLADCVLMHGVTNALLSAYVIVTTQWRYWG